MNIPCACQACGFVNEADWSQIGQWIPCLGCGKTLIVPAPMETIGPEEPPKAVVKFRCPSCNRKFATKPELAGKKIRCTGCGAGVRVPERDPVYWSADDAQSPPQPEPQPPAAAARYYSRPEVSQAPRAPAHPLTPKVAAPAYRRTEAAPPGSQPVVGRAPEVVAPRPRPAEIVADSQPMLDELASLDGIKAPRRAGTVLSSRSEMLELIRQQAPEETAATEEKSEKTPKKKKKKRKKAGYFDAKETLKLVAGVAALVAVLALLAWGYPDLRFPLGGFLCVIGFVVYLLGVTSLRQLVAEEGVFKALLFRFFPPYQWWYIATRWGETKDFVAFFGAGMLILSIGSAVIKTSAVGKRAEAGDRAYQAAKQGRQAELSAPAPVVGPSRKGLRAEIPPSAPSAELDDED